MNQSQIKYARQCFEIYKNRLCNQYAPYSPKTKPPEIQAAEKTIEENQVLIANWRNEYNRNRVRIQQTICNRIQRLEEQLILGGADSDIAATLAQLDSWNPTEEV